MVGERVWIEKKNQTGTDEFNAPVYSEPYLVPVDNVLAAPGPRSDIIDGNRLDGHLVKYTLHFPKTFNEPLEGLRVFVRGSYYRVIGAPDHYTLENTPGQWWMPVEVEDVHG